MEWFPVGSSYRIIAEEVVASSLVAQETIARGVSA